MMAADPVILAPYEPQWPALFFDLAKPIREAMGAVALRIDHIGSTAMPTIRAKPVIWDILRRATGWVHAPDGKQGQATLDYRSDLLPPQFTRSSAIISSLRDSSITVTSPVAPSISPITFFPSDMRSALKTMSSLLLIDIA